MDGRRSRQRRACRRFQASAEVIAGGGAAGQGSVVAASRVLFSAAVDLWCERQ